MMKYILNTDPDAKILCYAAGNVAVEEVAARSVEWGIPHDRLWRVGRRAFSETRDIRPDDTLDVDAKRVYFEYAHVVFATLAGALLENYRKKGFTASFYETGQATEASILSALLLVSYAGKVVLVGVESPSARANVADSL
jgi:hypothetical protein